MLSTIMKVPDPLSVDHSPPPCEDVMGHKAPDPLTYVGTTNCKGVIDLCLSDSHLRLISTLLLEYVIDQ